MRRFTELRSTRVFCAVLNYDAASPESSCLQAEMGVINQLSADSYTMLRYMAEVEEELVNICKGYSKGYSNRLRVLLR